MEFGLSRAILLASSSGAGRRPATNRSATRFELSRYVEIAINLSATGRKPGLRSAHELVADLLGSWTARDRPNSITLSSSLAGRRSARELVR